MSAPTGGPDPTVWREYGEPLAVGAATGPLAGQRIALKDLYALTGSRVGAGNPTWLTEAPQQRASATVVRTLLEAGAVVQGIAQTDELAYSLAGTNAHYGTPPNPRATGRIPGGSSSGSAAAVALGQADIGLGTDTGGSIRVPAAYQGLFGIRTTHDLLPRDGLLPLAPSFDTVGWVTRDAATLAAVGDVLLPASGLHGADAVVVPGLLDLADAEVAEQVDRVARGWGDPVSEEAWDVDLLPTWLSAFQTWQGWEAWGSHGAWLEGRLDVLGADVRGRFETASRVGAAEATEARGVLDDAAVTIRDLVGDRVLLLPSTSSVAPPVGADADDVQATRQSTLRLTCLAGIAGLPAVSVPMSTAAGLPCGVCLVARPGSDRLLIDLARTISTSRA